MHRRLVLAVAAGAAVLLSGLSVQAQDWPSRPVRLINPFAAGSAVDVVARVVANQLAINLGHQFVVDNRTGAAGQIGTDAAAKARPDGYTILVGSPGSMGINPFLYPNIPYDAVKDFVPVVHLVSFAQMLAAHPSLPVRTVAEMIDYARARPGQLNYGSSGAGSTAHLAFALLTASAKIEMAHIPFRGGSPAIQALTANEVQFAVEGLPSLAGPIASGAIRPLGVTSLKRWPGLPDVPAISETLPDFDTAAWVILYAPTGTPDAIVQRLANETVKALSQPEMQARMTELGATTIAADQPTTAAFYRKELVKWEQAVRISGAKPE